MTDARSISRLAAFATILASSPCAFSQSVPSAAPPVSSAPTSETTDVTTLPLFVVRAADPTPPTWIDRADPVPSGMRRRRIATPYTGGPYPDIARVESRANRVEVGAGIAAFAGGWLASLIGFFGTVNCTSSWFFRVSCSSGPREMLIPVLGPFIALGDRTNSAVGNALLVTDGLIQAGGLALMIVGFATRHEVLVHYELELVPPRRARHTRVFPAGSASGIGIAF